MFLIKKTFPEIYKKVKNYVIEDVCFEEYWDNSNFDSDIVSVRKSEGIEDGLMYQKISTDSNIEDIDYHINRYGYRTSPETNENFKQNLIACFGCSNTFGIGLKWENSWPSVLNQKLGEEWSVKNYGVCGGSNDLICRLIHNYTLKNSPKAICCFFPDIFRMEVFYDGGFNKFITNHEPHESTSEYYKNRLKHYVYENFLQYENAMYNFIKNFKFIENLCNSKNIKFYWFTWGGEILESRDEIIKKFLNYDNFLDNIITLADELTQLPTARDGIHYGKELNAKIANGFYEKILNSI